MNITTQKCDKMWDNLTPYQKKEMMISWEKSQETKRKYDLNDDVWGHIKEFAGIYHIATDWDKVWKVSAYNLKKWYNENTRYYISIPSNHNAETKKRTILKYFYKKPRDKQMMESLHRLINPKHYAVKKDFTKYRVGQEIIYELPPLYGFRCGVIKKVNKASINVDFYTEILEEREYGRSSYIFNKEIIDFNKTIKTYFKSDDELEDTDRLQLVRRICYWI